MRIRRSRAVHAPAAEVWAVVADAHHLPRWWPRTTRVEAVREGTWTSVLTTDRGRTVRADYRVVAAEPGLLLRWEQELEGTPFARILREAVTEVRVDASGKGVLVTLEVRQRPRGWARLGAAMLRRATRRQLEEALAALAALVEDPAIPVRREARRGG